ncbi:hypothetical protein HK097_010951 [Rhizophlyctis rosea]|uniref:Nitrogen regulatory protein areA GATA-like domain-containing protein n=1 Tax=Rhizophlyctis rosea TaxID=64517 RepID=A0AAD5X7B7_9FUNG|nr:hypothetical protein HK097_010951 [Rhizophlyctis rosea]
MPAHLTEPVLTLAFGNLQKLQTIDESDIQTIWNVFSKCKDNLENGRRLENISWRLWYRSSHGVPGKEDEPDLPTPMNIVAVEATVQKGTKTPHLSPSSFNRILKTTTDAKDPKVEAGRLAAMQAAAAASMARQKQLQQLEDEQREERLRQQQQQQQKPVAHQLPTQTSQLAPPHLESPTFGGQQRLEGQRLPAPADGKAPAVPPNVPNYAAPHIPLHPVQSTTHMLPPQQLHQLPPQQYHHQTLQRLTSQQHLHMQLQQQQMAMQHSHQQQPSQYPPAFVAPLARRPVPAQQAGPAQPQPATERAKVKFFISESHSPHKSAHPPTHQQRVAQAPPAAQVPPAAFLAAPGCPPATQSHNAPVSRPPVPQTRLQPNIPEPASMNDSEYDDSDFMDSEYSDDEDDYSDYDEDEWCDPRHPPAAPLFEKVHVPSNDSPRHPLISKRSLLSAALKTSNLARAKPSQFIGLNRLGTDQATSSSANAQITSNDSTRASGDEGDEFIEDMANSVGSAETVCGVWDGQAGSRSSARSIRSIRSIDYQQQHGTVAAGDPTQTEWSESLRRNVATERAMPFNTRLVRGLPMAVGGTLVYSDAEVW